MKHIKKFNESSVFDLQIQEIVSKIKDNRLHTEGKEWILNNIIINLLDSIWGKEHNMNKYSTDNLNKAIEEINNYLS